MQVPRARSAPCASPALRAAFLALVLPAALALGACSNLTQQRDLTSVFKPYRIDVIQGNFISKEMADALKPGMSKEQVREILGTPLLQDIFHADRWEYVFSLRQGYHAPIVRRYTVFFDKAGKMVRAEGDPLPSENAFVAQINALREGGGTPKVLSEAQLEDEIAAAQKKMAAHKPVAAASASQGPLQVVAPAAEISKLEALTAASSPSAAASAPVPAASGAQP
ncbi:outer membrane protein assembly factor BamE [Thiomonas delicata]|uniref:Outer membrane protein assembly factor BamE n=1 Tax=Thiomonas delicata TaxID=364030 RepID=A0A238D1X1_THIDL|nr:outer membrane protein assembly factor BamE [Thiomonas delicata]SBP87229.1 putative Small protein A (TmRNA-binding) SmpA [Thiomonas delicata]